MLKEEFMKNSLLKQFAYGSICCLCTAFLSSVNCMENNGDPIIINAGTPTPYHSFAQIPNIADSEIVIEWGFENKSIPPVINSITFSNSKLGRFGAQKGTMSQIIPSMGMNDFYLLAIGDGVYTGDNGQYSSTPATVVSYIKGKTENGTIFECGNLNSSITNYEDNPIKVSFYGIYSGDVIGGIQFKVEAAKPPFLLNVGFHEPAYKDIPVFPSSVPVTITGDDVIHSINFGSNLTPQFGAPKGQVKLFELASDSSFYLTGLSCGTYAGEEGKDPHKNVVAYIEGYSNGVKFQCGSPAFKISYPNIKVRFAGICAGDVVASIQFYVLDAVGPKK
jgi:hypothetical protein